MVALDHIGEATFCLTNLITAERRQLPMGEWELMFDPGSGEGVVFNTEGGGSELLVGELFKKVVFDGSGGDLYVLDEQKAGRFPCSLTRARAKHRGASVTLQLGATSAEASVKAWAFIWPKSGNPRLCWGIFALCGVLKMTSHHKQPSKWFFNQLPTWESAIATTFADQQFVYSCHGLNAHRKAINMDWHMRCLPTPAVSTAGFIYLLVRWAFSTKRHGGLSTPSQRQGSVAILEALVAEERLVLGRLRLPREVWSAPGLRVASGVSHLIWAGSQGEIVGRSANSFSTDLGCLLGCTERGNAAPPLTGCVFDRRLAQIGIAPLVLVGPTVYRI